MEVFIIVVLIAKASFVVTNFKLNSKYKGGEKKERKNKKEEKEETREKSIFI